MKRSMLTITIICLLLIGIPLPSQRLVPNLSASQQSDPLLVATEQEVKQFFATYVERYNSKDLKGFMSLLSRKVTQNQVDDIEAIRELYTDVFNQSRELQNSFEEMKIQIFQNAVEAKARYTVNQVLKEGGQKRVWKGNIRWILVKEEGSLKITSIDFRHSASPSLMSAREPKPKEEPLGKAYPKSEILLEGKKAPPPVLPLLAKETEVQQFFANYIDRYNRKDINGFLSFFSSKAVQNQRDGIEKIREIYSNFFDQSQDLRNQLEGMKMEIYQNSVEVKAQFRIDQTLKKPKGEKVWKGNIRWVLVKEDGNLKISALDYQYEKSP